MNKYWHKRKKYKHMNTSIVFFSKSKGKHIRKKIYNLTKAEIAIGTLLTVMLFSISLTFGQYKTVLACNDESKVSQYSIDLKIDNEKIENFIPKTERTIDFQVLNYENNDDNTIKKNEINLKYKIAIKEGETRLPISFELSMVDNEDGQEVLTSIPLNDSTTEWMGFIDDIQIHNYRLNFVWDRENEVSYQYSNITEKIQIEVIFEQID